MTQERTEIDEVAPESILELGTVELERAPVSALVSAKASGSGVEREGGGVADMADNALLGLAQSFLTVA